MSSEKQNMLQRIYNMYEDEYDDTYDDINEVSGPVELDAMEDEDAVDIVKRSATNNTSDAVDRELLQIYIDKPDIFKRSARKSSERAVLRQRMDMTDEQLEAWCIMLDRNASICGVDLCVYVLTCGVLLLAPKTTNPRRLYFVRWEAASSFS